MEAPLRFTLTSGDSLVRVSDTIRDIRGPELVEIQRALNVPAVGDAIVAAIIAAREALQNPS